MKLKDLNKSENNPRVITDENLVKLEKAVRTFGSLDGIVYNKALEKLVTFHQRQEVLDGDAEIEIVERFKKPTSDGTVAVGFLRNKDQVFPYREVMFDENTHNAAMVAANNHAGDWVRQDLVDIVLDLDAANIDLDLTLMNTDFLEDIVAPVDEKEPKDKKCPHCGKKLK